ncbi:MAG: nitroreductase family protein [Actinomycetota bacterium]
MDALDAIMTRRSMNKVAERRPDQDAIRTLIEAAVRAPNHHLTQPWRFIVLGGSALGALGDAMAERLRRETPDDPFLDQKAERERAKAFRAPVIVTVVFVPSSNPKAIEVEDRYAVGAAIENMLLAAHALGLGVYLRTGPAAYDAGVRQVLGLTPEEEVAGFLYLGYVDGDPPEMPPRAQAAERTTWVGWD